MRANASELKRFLCAAFIIYLDIKFGPTLVFTCYHAISWSVWVGIIRLVQVAVSSCLRLEREKGRERGTGRGRREKAREGDGEE